MRKLFLDFDGVTVATTEKICELYNEDYKNHANFKEAKWYLVNKWNFSDQCTLASKDIINGYFADKRFFDNLKFMENAKEIIEKLSTNFDITIVSMGDTYNLKYKEDWVNENFPYVNFIGCNFNDVNDKSSIDMSGGILIDDCSWNLKTSNANIKILYGDIFSWNSDWNGIRKFNWYEVYNFLMK